MKKHYSKLVSAVILAAALVPAGRAQPVSDVTVLSNPDGPWFYVDGTVYYHAMSAFWPEGSLHYLWSPYNGGYSYNLNQTVQWQFQGWQWAGGSSSESGIEVMADPTIRQYMAVFSTQYLFTIQMACNPAPCPSVPGAVQINGGQINLGIATGQSSWWAPGSGLTLAAAPYPGWLFAGWQIGNNSLVSGNTSVVTLAAPTTATAVFVPAKQVNFATSPPNMQFYADGVLITTPASLYWGLGTSHSIADVVVQEDSNAKRWVFASWSDGGAPSHTYVVGNNFNPETITAIETPAAYPFFTTSPPNLSLVVDGVPLPPPYVYIWGVGSTHTLTATTPQIDAQGNAWAFTFWDNFGASPSQTITIPAGADVNGYRATAFFAEQARLIVGSSLAGVAVTVDGVSCTTPCSVVRSMGTQVHVSAPASVPVGTGSRQDFLGWSVGGAAPVPGDWIATLNAPSTTIAATYHLMNSLTATSNPTGGASWTILPASPDGFYDSQTLVTLAVTAQPGYRFSDWTGDLSGTVPSGSLTMSVPHQVVAQFSKVPYIAAGGVVNAAGTGPGPHPGLAPGSIVAVYGANLAASTALGPASPMVQTLAGATVHIGSSLLPLYFASPAQFNLQIPSSLALGAQTITVSSLGMPDVSANFTAVRNAPGVFPVLFDGKPYAVVVHQDGTLVTLDAPAKIGELLTVYGTGFGPTAPVRPQGIAVPLLPPYLVVDPVTVQVGSSIFTPKSAFAEPGAVGVDMVQFQLDSSVPSGNANLLFLTVNGVSSNTLALPVQ
jgi:uncharacterized protein (TIGR03437 family)